MVTIVNFLAFEARKSLFHGRTGQAPQSIIGGSGYKTKYQRSVQTCDLDVPHRRIVWAHGCTYLHMGAAQRFHMKSSDILHPSWHFKFVCMFVCEREREERKIPYLDKKRFP